MFQAITLRMNIFGGSFHAAVIGISLNKRYTNARNRLNIIALKNLKTLWNVIFGRNDAFASWC
jgi:hypothetical protein